MDVGWGGVKGGKVLWRRRCWGKVWKGRREEGKGGGCKRESARMVGTGVKCGNYPLSYLTLRVMYPPYDNFPENLWKFPMALQVRFKL